ncbi:MAG: pteridine reductase [Gammaproteobacteria bacterium]|nr:pteridine reductase [Gammaproteobacteria bacterium]
MLNNQNNNNNRVVLITAGAKRIGAVIAEHFHRHNYNIIIHYRSAQSELAAHDLAKKLNNLRQDSAMIVQAELGSLVEPQCSTVLINKTIGFYGRLDVLVNNASSFFPTEIGKIDLAAWRDLMISNVGGPFFLAQSLAPYLNKTHGCIINISDIHADRPLKGYSVYSIAKAANNMVTKSLARELAPNIRVNAVAPGPSLAQDSDVDFDSYNKEMQEKTLLKKLSSPLDIAEAVLFLAEAQSITGQILAIDGGRSVKL